MSDFSFINETNLPLTANVTSDFVTLTGDQIKATKVIVVNDGDKIAFVTSGFGSSSATSSNFPVQAGTSQVFKKPRGHDKLAGICPGGPTQLYFIPTDHQ